MADEELNELKLKALENKEIYAELNSVRKNAKIYKQLQNSNIFFREDLVAAKSEVQKNLGAIEKAIAELGEKKTSN